MHNTNRNRKDRGELSLSIQKERTIKTNKEEQGELSILPAYLMKPFKIMLIPIEMEEKRVVFKQSSFNILKSVSSLQSFKKRKELRIERCYSIRHKSKYKRSNLKLISNKEEENKSFTICFKLIAFEQRQRMKRLKRICLQIDSLRKERLEEGFFSLFKKSSFYHDFRTKMDCPRFERVKTRETISLI